MGIASSYHLTQPGIQAVSQFKTVAEMSLGQAQQQQIRARHWPGRPARQPSLLRAGDDWRAVTVALSPSAPSPPQAGHWLLEVDTSGAGNGDNINAYGVRAHDGDPGTGGTEIPIYAQPFVPFGVNGPDPMSNTFTFYPYVTGNCTVDFNEFDMDAGNTGDQGLLTANARGGG